MNNLQLQYNNFIVNSVKATVQVLYHVGVFDHLEIKDEILSLSLLSIQDEGGREEFASPTISKASN